MSTYRTDMVVQLVDGFWRVDVYRYERQRDPQNKLKWLKPKVHRTPAVFIPLDADDTSHVDVLLRAALHVGLVDVTCGPPSPPVPEREGGPLEETLAEGSTISEAAPLPGASASEASSVDARTGVRKAAGTEGA